MVSTIIGGGIASVPYAMTVAGFNVGIFVNLAIILVVLFCSHLYLKASEALQLSSFSELCYINFGRSSIFMINGLIAFVIYGVLTLYFILFSKICITLAIELTQQKNESIFQSKAFYIIILTLLLMPAFFAKEIKEMNF